MNQYKKEDFAWLEARAYNKYSQHGEDGLLEAIFERIGTANKWVMECGAADGVFFSNSKKLIDEGWSAALIEGDEEKAQQCKELYWHVDRVSVISEIATTHGSSRIDQLLWTGSHRVPFDLDLAVIDVDGPDYWLFNSLIKYRPRVVMVEYNPVLPTDFIPEIGATEGQAGLQAIIRLGVGKEYIPVVATRCNVIFVQRELAHLVAETAIDNTPLNEILAAHYGDCPVSLWIGAGRSLRQLPECTCKERKRLDDGELDDQPPIVGRPLLVEQEYPLAEIEARMKPGSEMIPHMHERKEGDGKCLRCGLIGNWPTVPRKCEHGAVRNRPMLGPFAGGHGRCRCCGSSFGTLNSNRKQCSLCKPEPARAQGISIPIVPVTHTEPRKFEQAQIAPKIVAVTSIPQLGHNVNFGCQLEALSVFGIPIRQCYGAYWHQTISEGIAEVLKQGVDHILTLDYDTLFTAQDIADLVTLAIDNPDVDVLIPGLCKREGNGLCAHTKEQDATKEGVNLNDPLIPIQLGHLGLTLFKASAFDRLEKPWMMPSPSETGTWGEGHVDADMNFWLNCERSGLKVMLARHVRIGHIEYMATIPNAADPRITDYAHIGEWRKWAVEVNKVVLERIRQGQKAYA